MAEIKFEIKESFGVLSESAKGWTKEINLVSWNNYPAKYDIREWDPEHLKMGKGVTFTADEIKELRDILNGLDL
ncbi:MAG: PC4/YdbC family ssDNA-binding protein [Tissierellaceae bacterium]|nr:PC4/YdbC family ssDNA-binding protein [Tissierellaceae bacterium]